MRKIVFLIFFISANILAQDVFSNFEQNTADSILTTVADTSAVADSIQNKDDLDAIVYATATDSLSFDVKNKKMHLYGDGNIKYKTTELKSADISIDFETSDLTAIGVLDSSEIPIGTPVLTEVSEIYEGTEITYNFKTQQGFISMAKNISGDKTYTGERVKKVDKNVFFVESGKFTTCDADTPHYHFSASKMKVMQGDKIVAKWIFINIGGVPIPVPLPWGVFPNRPGRASGIIAPNYGFEGSLGYYLRNFGYFWATNDYMDVTLTGDYYFKGGYGMRSRVRYKDRYSYNGNINGGFSKRVSGESGDPDYSEKLAWNINLNHNQKLTPTMQLTARLQFLSNDYLTLNSPNLRDRVQNDITSNATLSKRWEGSGTNLTINYNRTQNLETGNITEDLPSLSFSKNLAYPFRSSSTQGKSLSWYEYIGYSYTGKFKNNRKKTETESSIHGGLDHRVAISASPKLGYFNLSPSFSFNSKWYNKKQVRSFESTIDTSGNNIDYLFTDEVHDLNTVNTFNFNLSASTKLYGIAQPQMLGVEAFRHTFEPRLTYSYRPDFSENHWGYYDTYIDTNGNEIRYDPFGNQIFGGASSGESQRLSLSFGNAFEIKTIKDPTDTTSESQKVKLLDLGISSGYNFAADSLQLDDVSMNFRTQIGSLLSLHGSSVLSPYVYQNGREVNKMLISNGQGLIRLTSFNLNLSTRLSGDQFTSKDEEEKEEDEYENPENMFGQDDQSDYIELYNENEPDFSIPWNLNLTYNFNYTDQGSSFISRRSNLGFDLSFSLTQKWKLTFRGSYDITNKKLNAPQVTIYRDLHAWEANMVWNPIGTYRGFRFEIRIKAPEFRDLKLTKSKDIYGGF
ncbi:MAG: putative LPS assembly protein LptD [Bacteroidota bacterium]